MAAVAARFLKNRIQLDDAISETFPVTGYANVATVRERRCYVSD